MIVHEPGFEGVGALNHTVEANLNTPESVEPRSARDEPLLLKGEDSLVCEPSRGTGGVLLEPIDMHMHVGI